MWKYNIFELAKHHRVYAFDMVGAGRTDKPDAKYTFDFMAKFTHSLMEALNIPHANLIGASAGGGVALTFALKFPNRVDKLVIVGSAGLGKEVSWLLRLPTIPLLGELLGSPSRSGLAMLCKQAVYDPKLITNEVVEEFYQMATIKRAKEAMLSVGRENFNVWGQFYQPIVEKLNTITAPTLRKYGYPLMLASMEPVDGGMSCSINSIHYGNSNHYSSSVFLFIGATGSHPHTTTDIH
ncbi:alpha/beta fold hydrolase [Nostoc flagelliforme]|uniref:alpha/beta fold hydrolase n=1 Tax=Nostoc flagelliforme TaxID=1306274 RepID=UPI0018EFAA62|nr:alpha/beta fold hydrolase [Nostoc flagelliforme]